MAKGEVSQWGCVKRLGLAKGREVGWPHGCFVREGAWSKGDVLGIEGHGQG